METNVSQKRVDQRKPAGETTVFIFIIIFFNVENDLFF